MADVVEREKEKVERVTGKRAFDVLVGELEGEVAVVVELWGDGERDPMVFVKQGNDRICFPGNLWKRLVREVNAALAPEWRS